MKKKRVLLIIIIILLIVGGVGFYLYNTTDYLKTNQQLFWKYAVQNSEFAEMFNNQDMQEVKKKKNTNSYKSTSTLKIEDNNDIYTINTNTNAKNVSDITTHVDFNMNSNDIIDIDLIKKTNIVGLKIDELANGYITLKNSNLKDLAKKVGIEDQEKIPDNINVSTYMDLLDLSEENITYITDKYTNLIVNDTNKNNYSQGESMSIKINDKIHNGTAYKITLTENECKKILSDIFAVLSQDSRTLNLISSKMKLLNFPTEYTQTNIISKKFSEISNKINKLETTDDQFIEITVYVENSELLQTNLKIKEEKLIQILYDKENNKINIKQDLLKQEQNNNKFILSISDVLNKVWEQVQEINIENEVSNDKTLVTTKMEIICRNKLNIKYDSTTEITDDIQISDDYDNSLKIVLNDLTEAQLKSLYNVFSQSIPEIYEEKKNLILNERSKSVNNADVQQYIDQENQTEVY